MESSKSTNEEWTKKEDQLRNIDDTHQLEVDILRTIENWVTVHKTIDFETINEIKTLMNLVNKM